jgi:predicted transcriptional regulator YdeE
MAGEASVFQMSGGGYDYEHYVQSGFLLSMILQGSIPVFPNGKVKELSFQCKRLGYETDDLFLKIKVGTNEHKIIAQIKYNISITEKNETFFEVINAFWKDFNNDKIFDKQNDKLFLIKSSLTNDDKNQILVLLSWASTHKDEKDFFSEVERIKVKKDKLAVFSNLLKRANNNVDLSETELWEFLKCLHILAFDFNSESSISETNALNLIKLSKSESVETTPFEIWASIIVKASEFNRNGGTLTFEELKKIDLYKYFDLALTQEAYKAVKKLKDDSSLILKPLKSSIQDYHIERTSTKLSVIDSINKYPITFITGSPGVGKSAIVKELLFDELKDAFPFVFKADQFNKSTLSQVFGEMDITFNIVELFSTISLIQNKILIIDSAEKLLEGDPDNAFKQLLAVVEEMGDLKLILTSRSYAVNVITQKFGIKKERINLIEIPKLDDSELKEIEIVFPELTSLFSNKEVKEIMRSPKYLEFGLNAINKDDFKSGSEISLTDFKDNLWSQIIENSTVVRNGLPRKRGKSFSHIAVGRAKSMQLFFEPNDNEIDYEAVESLLNDNVIIKNKSIYEFSPSHDILEDWALIRHISNIEKNLVNKDELFAKLGNQPSMRRAFRLWVEELIISDIDTVVGLIKKTLDNDSVENYWTDEILTAIFRSNNCELFFVKFKKGLLEKNNSFLNRCILIIRTTCKEYNFNEKSSNDILFPIGSGWQEILFFIALYIEDTSSIRNSITKLLLDWEFKYIFNLNSCTDKEIVAANIIVLHYIKKMEGQNKFWFGSYETDQKESLVSMLFGFSEYSTEEIEAFLKRVSNSGEDDDLFRLRGFNELVVEKALGGLRTFSLVKSHPDLLIELANKHWKYIPPKKSIKENGPFGFNFPSANEREDSWGLVRHIFDFFPSGIYKTFVYNLLIQHPSKAIKFIIDFTNYMTLSYSNSEYGKKEDLKLLEIELNNGKKNEQFGNGFLWNAYRGTTVTHYLFESILLSLEKYLLNIAKQKTSDNKFLKIIIDYCLSNSNSVAITSVLVSVFIAHPKSFGKSIIPILKVKEFYELDLNRATSEHSALAIADIKISFAQKEKFDFNKLPHRKKYTRGLRDLILNYQINYGELNKEIHEIFDIFYKTSEENVLWDKAINEMDVRKYEATILDKGLIQLEVKYPEEVQKAVETFTIERKDENASLSYSTVLLNAKDSDLSELSFEKWNNIYTHFSSKDVRKSMFDMPVTLSVIGLKDFYKQLDKKQNEWCITIIAHTIGNIIKYINSRGYSFSEDISFNIMEQQTSIEASHLLFENIDDKKDLIEVEIMISYLMICSLADHEQKDFSKYLRKTFSESLPVISKDLFLFLIKYSKFIKTNKAIKFRSNKEEIEFKEKEFAFIKKTQNEKTEIKVDSISFDTYEPHFLVRALFMIPVRSNNKFHQDFILKLIELIINDLKLKIGDSFRSSKKDRKVDIRQMIELRFYLNEILIYNDLEFSKKMIDRLTYFYFEENFEFNYNGKDLYEFVSEVIDTTITRFEDVIVENKDPIIQKKYRNHFWLVWKHLYQKVLTSKTQHFRKQLLLDSKWFIKSSSWMVLEGEKVFYEDMLNYFGSSSLPSIINTFSTFGEKMFLPDGIKWIVKFIKDDSENAKHLEIKASVNLIKILFNNHISEIKENQKLVSDFMFILSKMVDNGSCDAYLIRECVIIYKIG